jgi:hypothetical protein
MTEFQFDVSGVPSPKRRPPRSRPAPRTNATDAPPILDRRALRGLARRVVEAIAPYTEAAEAALLIDFLVSFGNAVGPGPYMLADSARHDLKLFAVIVGATSRARKGTSRANIQRIFEQADPKWAANHVASGMSSGEGLIQALSAGDDGHAKRMLVVETEFGRVLNVAARQGNTLSDYFRQLWDGDRVHILNKEAVKLDGAFLSVLGHITAEELRVKMAEVDLSNGFANRVLWTYAERSKLIPSGSGASDEVVQRLADDVHRQLIKARRIGRMTRNERAQRRWAEYYEDVAHSDLTGVAEAVTSRAEAQMLRLSMVYAALDGHSDIKRQHIDAAYHLWRYCEDSAAWAFARSTGSSRADRLLQALREASDGRLKRCDVSRQVFGNNSTRPQIDTAISMLEERGAVRLEKARPTTGRPAVWIVLVAER